MDEEVEGREDDTREFYPPTLSGGKLNIHVKGVDITKKVGDVEKMMMR